MPARTIALMLSALLFGACASEGPLTHAELVERADAICADAFARVRENGADLPERDPASVERWADALGQTIPILEAMTDDLGDLDPPAEDGDSGAMSDPSEDATLAWADADHVASRLGLEGCRLFAQD